MSDQIVKAWNMKGKGCKVIGIRTCEFVSKNSIPSPRDSYEMIERNGSDELN